MRTSKEYYDRIEQIAPTCNDIIAESTPVVHEIGVETINQHSTATVSKDEILEPLVFYGTVDEMCDHVRFRFAQEKVIKDLRNVRN